MNAVPYRLLCSGSGRKWEDVGGVFVERQAGTALWQNDPAELQSVRAKVSAIHVRSANGGGHWDRKDKSMPEVWLTQVGAFKMETKLTSFGHFGFFAEQAPQWEWLAQQTQLLRSSSRPPLRMLNLFGYTGGASLAMMQGGAEVLHVDAAENIVGWASRNVAHNGLSRELFKARCEDAVGFLKKMVRRTERFDGIVMDPPSYGRGPRGEIFQIEESLPELLSLWGKLARPGLPTLFHCSLHTPGLTPLFLASLCRSLWPQVDESLESSELFVTEVGPRALQLPLGACVRGLLRLS